MLAQLNRLEEAESHIQILLDEKHTNLSPNHKLRALYVLGVMRLQGKRTEEAISALGKAIECDATLSHYEWLRYSR